MGKIEGTVLTSLSSNRDNCLGTEIELLNSLKSSGRHVKDSEGQ